MSTSWHYALRRSIRALALLTWVAKMTLAEETLSVTTANRPLGASSDQSLAPRRLAISPNHPLAWVVKFASDEQAYLHDTVRDFTCRLVKRERIGGFLQDNEFIDMCVREEIRSDNGIEQPMSIFLHFLGPARIAGRKVLYIEGQNDGKMLVRNGGRHFDYVIVSVDPFGESAREESLVPITQTGFGRVLGRMIDVLERHTQADPAGENTKVEKIAGAKLNSRLCTVIRVTHPRKQDGLEFHRANVFVDDELRVPVRVDFSLWPTREYQEPPLLAEYTYTKLKLNVNLPDSTFSRAQFRSSR
jgi:hypothetical protein